jgi:hypothetical protein
MAATVAMPGAATAAVPPGPVQVTLQPGGAVKWFTWNQLRSSGDVGPQLVTTRGGGGGESTRTVEGVSPKHLIELLHLAPASISSMTIRRLGVPPAILAQPPITLTATEITGGFDGDAACGSGCRATFQASPFNQTGALFFRPLRSASDTNPYDAVLAGGVGDDDIVKVGVQTSGGSVLRPTATASNTNPAASEPVSLSSTLDHTPAGTTFEWDFGDGSATVDGATPAAHTYVNGTYTAVVSVIAPDGSNGSASVAIQVGPKTGDAAATTPTPAEAGSVAAGAGSGGNGSGGGTATSGAGTSKGGASTGPSKSSGSGIGAASGGGKKKGHSGTRVPRAGDVAATAAQPAGSSAGASGGASAGGGAAAAATTPAPASTPAPGTPPASGITGTSPAAAPGPTTPQASAGATTPAGASGAAGSAMVRVSGLALEGFGRSVPAELLASAAADGDSVDPRSAARAAAGHGSQVAGWLTGAVVIIGLLGAGAAREWRRLPTLRSA